MAAAAVVNSNVSVSTPFHMPSHQRVANSKSLAQPQASSSRSPQLPSSSSDQSETLSKPFQRIRSSLEHSLRTATRSKKTTPTSPLPPSDDFATLTPKTSKGKEKEDDATTKGRKVLRRLESKVTFRKTGRESATPSASPVPPSPAAPTFAAKWMRSTKEGESNDDPVRKAGFTSYMTPSLRQASMSSPALHLSSQALPSPSSQSNVPASSSNPLASILSPGKDRSRRTSLQSTMRAKDISSPAPLAPKRESSRSRGGAATTAVSSNHPSSATRETLPSSPVTPSRHHKVSKSTPAALPTSASTTSLHNSGPSHGALELDTPPGRGYRETHSPPTTPTPISGSRSSQLGRTSSRAGAKSSSYLPLTNQPPPSPTSAPRSPTPTRARSPSASRTGNRVITPNSPRLTSPSASHLPPSTPPSKARRPSIDSPQRPIMSVNDTRGASPAPRNAGRSAFNASPSLDQSQSSTAVRSRPISPSQRTYAQNRHFNLSTTSLGAPPDPEHSEAIRTAVGLLCKELARGPWYYGRNNEFGGRGNNESAKRDWEEVEVRTTNLARMERVWGKGAAGAGSQVSLSGQHGSSGLSSSGEERLRRVFCEALRDGFVLCQLMNKLRSCSVVRPDAREDGFMRTANVTKFLAACSSYGLPSEDLFQRDDLIEASGESLARVAKTIIALIKYAESPNSQDRSKILTGSGMKMRMGSTPANGNGHAGPYGSVSRAAASTPNLALAQRSTSPVGHNPPSSPVTRKRYSPPAGLPPVRSDSPSESGHSSSGKTEKTAGRSEREKNGKETASERGVDKSDVSRSRATVHEAPPTPPKDSNQGKYPPPRSPLRPSRMSRRNADDEDLGMFKLGLNSGDSKDISSSPHTGRLSVADSTRAEAGDYSFRESVTDSLFTTASTHASTTSGPAYAAHIPSTSATAGGSTGAHGDRSSSVNVRQSVASSAMTDTTAYSSLLDAGLGGRPHSNSSGYNKFGTIRTITTEATSEAPSFGREEGSAIVASLLYGEELSRKRTPRSSDGPVVDLSRVAEETDDSGSSMRFHGRDMDNAWDRGGERSKGRGRDAFVDEERAEKPAIRLGKGKWPDDFLDALQPHNHSQNHRLIPVKSSSPDLDDASYPSSPLSISPPRKLAIVGATRRNESLESIPQFPRRPTHRARHSIDAPALLPKESILRRDVSPDGISSNRVMLRRHSTKPAQRNGVYLPRTLSDEHRNSADSDSLVPFPRSASGEHGSGTPSPRPPSNEEISNPADRPRLLRGRFQSDIQGDSSRRRARPTSYDELGAKPQRSRFESMVNLGVASNNASASDLISRDSMDGSAVRRPLIIREEGKPPTHFQLGNCIGRGQFGSVYRALNLNTGQMVAVKRIRLEGLKESEVTQLMREVDLVKSLSHPSIVKYEGMARDEDTLSIVLEYAESGSLVQTIKAFGKLNENLVAGYVVKILEGLHYLHQSGVVHCDLKAANILTTKTGNVKLADFGVSLNMRAMEREMTDVAGTPNWMAPEVIELKGASPKSDIWSLGCTVVELLTGKPPYAEIANSMSVMFRIVEDAMPPLPEGCSPMCDDFLRLCFNKDPEQRPGAEMLCEHPWLSQNYAALKDLRPQDSIPFLRRVSQDLQQKTDVLRYLAGLDPPDTPVSENIHRSDDGANPSPVLGRRTSHSSVRPSLLSDNEISPREHTFVKTTFSKPMLCRVCQESVKKSAVLCAQCSLIAHSKCAPNAPPTCDLRAQLLLYAHYAEKGNPASIYSNPVDISNDGYQAGPASDVPYIAHSPRTSLDMATPPQSPPSSSGTNTAHPPTAFKFMAAFKRSRSNLTPEPAGPSSSSLAVPRDDKLPRGRSGMSRKDPKERPLSISSLSTNANSSLRSAATAAESFNSRHSRHVVTRSMVSADDLDDDTRESRFSAGHSDGARSSRFTAFSAPEEPPASAPAVMLEDNRKTKKHSRDSKSSSNCIVQ